MMSHFQQIKYYITMCPLCTCINCYSHCILLSEILEKRVTFLKIIQALLHNNLIATDSLCKFGNT